MYSTLVHFLSAAEIWQAYFDHVITMAKRDRLLDELRARLRKEVPLPR